MNKLTLDMIKLISDSTLEEIARVNNTTVEIARLAVGSGNEVACSQFTKLFKIGYYELNKLAV